VALASVIAFAQSDEAKLLARPVTPGTIAQLANYPKSDAAEARLREALTSTVPQLRAAAARVVLATADRSLISIVGTALDSEKDVDALVEQSRALAFFGGADSSARILAAWQRVPADRVLLSIAAARGTDALEHLPIIREGTDREQLLALYLRLASRRDPDRLTDVARTAIRRVDRTLLSASFRAWDDARVAVPFDVMTDALRSPSAVRIVDAVFWYLLEHWQDTAAERRDALREEILAAVDHRDDTALDGPARIAYELIGRAFDRPARGDEPWLADLAKPASNLEQLLSTPAIARLWTDRERTILAGAYGVNRQRFEAPTTVTVGQKPREQASIEAVSGYPAGFVSSVLSANNCKPQKFDNAQFNAGGAQVTLRDDGRVSQLALVNTGISSACASAARTLLFTFVAPIEDINPEGRQILMMVPFLTPFVACQDSSLGPRLTSDAAPRAGLASASGPEPQDRPTLVPVFTPKPSYTRQAMEERVEGEVQMSATLSPRGCVRSAGVVRHLHPQLDWVALWDSLAFGFRPTGIEQDVRVNIVLDFNLR
jgi:hypothetical protein